MILDGMENMGKRRWDNSDIDEIARLDGIVPPTGMALREVLHEFYGEDLWGRPMMIITWETEK